MDPIFQTFVSWQFLIFSTAIVAIVFVTRKIAEYLLANWKPAAKESKLWNDLILPILPIFVGSIGALIFKKYPYPDGLVSGGSRFIFGLVAGLLSTVLYRLVLSKLVAQMGANSQSTTDSSMSAGKVDGQ